MGGGWDDRRFPNFDLFCKLCLIAAGSVAIRDLDASMAVCLQFRCPGVVLKWALRQGETPFSPNAEFSFQSVRRYVLVQSEGVSGSGRPPNEPKMCPKMVPNVIRKKLKSDLKPKRRPGGTPGVNHDIKMTPK